MEINKVRNLSFKSIDNKALQPVISDEKPKEQEVGHEYMSKPSVDALKNTYFYPNKNYSFIGDVKLPYIDNRAKVYRLNNGQKVVILKKSGPAVIKTFVKVGSMNEPDNIRGISHYIEHNLFNGSKEFKPGEFVDTVTNMGGKYNAATGFMSTNYYIVSPLHNDGDLAKFIKMHSDMLLNPTYAKEQLEKEKGPVESEIQMLGDSPENLGINRAIKNLFNIETKSSDLIGGSVENIKNLNKEQVLDYYKKWYHPRNMTTVVIGDVEPENVLKLIDKNFNVPKEVPHKEEYYEPLMPINSSVRKDITSPNTQSVLLNMAFAGPKNNSVKDSIALEVLLGSLVDYKNARLNLALKPFNIGVSVGSDYVSGKPFDPSVVLLNTSVADGRHEEVLKTIYSTLHEMAYNPLKPEELDIVKSKIKNSFKASSESNMDISGTIGNVMLQTDSMAAYSNYLNILKSITPQDVMNAAKKYLDLHKVSIVAVHPENQPMKLKQVSFTGKDIELGEVSKYKLNNNIELVKNNIKDATTCSFVIKMKAPTISEPKTGADILLGKMLTYGISSMKEEAFDDIKDKNNIETFASSDYNALKMGVNFPEDVAAVAFDMLSKNLLQPNFTEENLKRAKEEIKNVYLASTKTAADRAIEAIYAGSPKANTLRTIVLNLDNVTLDDVKNHYKNILNNSNAKAIISGNFDKNKSLFNTATTVLSKELPTFKPEEKPILSQTKPLEKNKVILEAEQRNQAEIVQMIKMKTSGNVKDDAATIILNEILGGNSNSRLFKDLRETQKLAYRVNSNFVADDENEGLLVLRILTTTENGRDGNQFENIQKSLDGFKKHLNNFVEKEVSDEELEAAKLQVKSKLHFSAESTKGKTSLVFSSMMTPYKENYLKSLVSAIDNLTKEDIKNLAEYYLKQPSVISVLAGKETLKNNAEYFKSLGEVQAV